MSTLATKDTTRQQLIAAAAHQFARKSYNFVSLDDILAEAELTKGAMYFHFRSKQALALALLEEFKLEMTASISELLGRRLSGLETIIDFSYHLAYQTVVEDLARSSMHLVESVGRPDGLFVKMAEEWVALYAGLVRRAVSEGDVVETQDPAILGRILTSMHLGVRQTSDLDQPDVFLNDLRDGWLIMLPGFVAPERVEYFRQFIRRRTGTVLNRIVGYTAAGNH